jgi:hypothetical protein
MKKLLESIFGALDRPLIIGEIEIPCYVLENKQRVITQRGFQTALGMSKSGGKKGERRILELLNKKSIQPLVDNDLRERTENIIQFKSPTGLALGYDALLLQEIVRVISKAYLKGILSKQQEHIGRQCEILDDGFSKVGIVALIDEATGYQTIRDKDALQQFLNKFLLEERAKWIGTYPDEFFEVIFKMKGWTWNYASTKKPSVVGHYINNFVYSRLAPKVLTELKEKNPVIETESGKHRKYKHTQFITSDYGHPILKEHLHAVIALAKGAGFNWTNFQRLLNRAFPKYGKDMEIDFKDDDIIE